MHELGLSQNCCAITYRAKEQDESEIARKITSDIQMPHRIIDMTSYKVSADKMEAFFAAQITPSLDLCATIYLHCGLEAFSGAELIDGMGNDLFIGHIPAPSELKANFIISAWCLIVSKNKLANGGIFISILCWAQKHALKWWGCGLTYPAHLWQMP